MRNWRQHFTDEPPAWIKERERRTPAGVRRRRVLSPTPRQIAAAIAAVPLGANRDRRRPALAER